MNRSSQAAARAPDPDANLEADDFRRQLIAVLEIAQQSPEVSDRVGDGLRVVRVGRAPGQRRLESLARQRLPVAEMAPEQAIEAPDQTVAIGLELVQIEVVVAVGLGAGANVPHRPRQIVGESSRLGLTQIDRDLGQAAASVPAGWSSGGR